MNKQRLSALEAKAKKYDNFLQQLGSEKYKGSTLGNLLIGVGASLVPQSGYLGLAVILPFVLGSVLMNAGISVDLDNLVTSLPGRDTIQSLVTENAIDTIMFIRESITANCHIFVSSDKGNQKGKKNLAKFICWYDRASRKVKTFLLDVDCADEDTSDIAEVILHLLKRSFPADFDIKLDGQCTDSGGGGTKHAFSRAMKAKGLTIDHYLTCTCLLHNLQTCLRNSVQNFMGEGGVDDEGEYVRNVMQMLHGAYNLQNWQENDELKELWKYLAVLKDEEVRFKKNGRTNCYSLVACWCLCLQFQGLHWYVETYLQGNPQFSSKWYYQQQIASCALNLMTNKAILNDIELLVAFHSFFLFPHFKFLQDGDKECGGTPSFIARHMTV